jgi:hypothetical protein
MGAAFFILVHRCIKLVTFRGRLGDNSLKDCRQSDCLVGTVVAGEGEAPSNHDTEDNHEENPRNDQSRAVHAGPARTGAGKNQVPAGLAL